VGRKVAAAEAHRGDLHPTVVVATAAAAVAVVVETIAVVVVTVVEFQRARLAALVVGLRRCCSYA